MKKMMAALVLLSGFFFVNSASGFAGDRAQNGSTVSFIYFMEANGVTIVSKDKKDTMSVTIGSGTHPAALEKSLIGLKKGDVKNIELTPQQGFGPVREELIKRISKQDLPPTIQFTEGAILAGKSQRPIRVAKVLEDSVVLDENHPFAGKTLDYHVKVTDVQ